MNASSNYRYEQLGHNPNFEIALNMPLEQLRFYCINNELFKSICKDQEFWRERLRREYPNIIQYKPEDITWGQYYLQAPLIYQLVTTPGIFINYKNPAQVSKVFEIAERIKNGTIKIIVVLYNDEIIGKILMFPSDKEMDVYMRAATLLYTLNPAIDFNTTILEPMRFRPKEYRTKENHLVGKEGYIQDVINNSNWRDDVYEFTQFEDSLFDKLQVINMYQGGFYTEGEYLSLAENYKF